MDARQSRRFHQRGVVLIFSLIVLLILTIGAVALMRSMNNSLFSAGNLAFRRDLTNQGERAITNVLTQFQPGGALAAAGATQANAQNLNYSATVLPTNAEGVPNALLNQTTFGTVGTTANDLTGPTPDITIRYVIDRLCSAAGASTSALCVMSTAGPTGGTGGRGIPPPPLPTATVYRVSVRVSGARGTQIFLQTTFSMPDT